MHDLRHTPTISGAIVHREPGSLLQSVKHHNAAFTVESVDEILISMTLFASYSMTFRAQQSIAEIAPVVGRFGILTPGHPVSLDIRGCCSVLQVKLPLGRFSDWITEDHGVDGASIEARSGYLIDDPIIAHLVCRAKSAGTDGEEEWLRSLATRLLMKHSSISRVIPLLNRGGLTSKQLRQVAECVNDRLPGKITLNMMANSAGISPFHFLREFKRSTGCTPHRYVMNRRLSRAVIDLGISKRSVANIAATNGYTHASHFAQDLKRTLGCTPGDLRKSVM